MTDDIRTKEELLHENAMLRRWVSELGAANTRDRQMREPAGDDTCLQLYRETLALKGQLREIKERYHAMLGALPDLLFLQTSDGTFIDYNALSSAKYFVPPHEFLGKKPIDIFPAEIAERCMQCIQAVLGSGTPRTVEYMLPHATDERYFEGRVVPCGENRVLTIVRDITDRKQFESCLRDMATHDTLTELPNRLLFQDRLAHAVDRSRRSGLKVVLLFLDLDGFKDVNDTCGHKVGDALLREIAGRIRSCVRGNDTVARFGGDEFTVVLEDINGPAVIIEITDRILETVARPVQIENYKVSVTTSIGVAVWPDDSPDPCEIMVLADRAMYVAKRAGKNATSFYKMFSK